MEETKGKPENPCIFDLQKMRYGGFVQDEAHYKELIDTLGLQDRQTHLLGELSGGQNQRTAIVRALINQPELILADEPTGNLNCATGQEIIQIFQEIHKQGKTVILVTHDKEIAAKCQREIKILDGKILESRNGTESFHSGT